MEKLSFTRKEQSMGCTFIRRLYWIKNLEIRARAEFDGHATLEKGTIFLAFRYGRVANEFHALVFNPLAGIRN